MLSRCARATGHGVDGGTGDIGKTPIPLRPYWEVSPSLKREGNRLSAGGEADSPVALISFSLTHSE